MSENIKLPHLRAGGMVHPIVPQSMEDTYRLAVAVARANMAPAGLETPEKIMVAMMYGMEIGLMPMAAIQRIALVNNRPTIWGDAAIALVRASGQLERFRETMEGEGDARVAVCFIKRKGFEDAVEKRFSVQDAITAGLWSPDAHVTRFKKDGGTYQKDNDSPWHRFPERMLTMRARGFALRDLFADVLGGMYLREEIEGDYRDMRVTDDHQPPVPAVIKHMPDPPTPIVPDRETQVKPEPRVEPASQARASLGEAEIGEILDRYRDAADMAQDTDTLDAAWGDHISPVENKLPREAYEHAAAIDDRRRGILEL